MEQRKWSCPDDLKRELLAAVKKEDTSESRFVRQAVREKIARAPLRDYPQEDADVHA